MNLNAKSENIVANQVHQYICKIMPLDQTGFMLLIVMQKHYMIRKCMYIIYHISKGRGLY